MGWFQKLQNRWGVTAKQVIIILVVFALTGTTVMLLRDPVEAMFTDGEKSTLFSVFYYILIFPIYIIILLIYGWIFGQYNFFKAFASKSVSRFKRKKGSKS